MLCWSMIAYRDLAKFFHCPTRTVMAAAASPDSTRVGDLQTGIALAYEAGMRFLQDTVNSTAYRGIFTSIFSAALIMLLIEMLCIALYFARKRNWLASRGNGHNPSTSFGGNGTKYSFLIQGPKVLHHGVFEVTNSLSIAGLQVRLFLYSGSNSNYFFGIITQLETKQSQSDIIHRYFYRKKIECELRNRREKVLPWNLP